MVFFYICGNLNEFKNRKWTTNPSLVYHQLSYKGLEGDWILFQHYLGENRQCVIEITYACMADNSALAPFDNIRL